MYAKLIDGKVIKYPYTFEDLKKDNPNTSFPAHITDVLLEEQNLVRVVVTGSPEIDPMTQNVFQTTPVFNAERNRWETSWVVEPATEQEIADRLQSKLESIQKKRLMAYREESDPLFFKWQRDEISKQEWLDKVAEIKNRFPK